MLLLSGKLSVSYIKLIYPFKNLFHYLPSIQFEGIFSYLGQVRSEILPLMTRRIGNQVLPQWKQRNSKINCIYLISVTAQCLGSNTLEIFYIFKNKLSEKCLILQINDLFVTVFFHHKSTIFLGFLRWFLWMIRI